MQLRWLAVPVVVAALVMGGCATTLENVGSASPESVGSPVPSSPPRQGTPVPDPTVPPTSTPRPTPTAAPTATATPSPTAAPTATVAPSPTPAWSLTIEEIDDATRARIEPTSWRPGCPVGLEGLRLLTFPYVDFAGGVREGELIVAADWADDIGRVFERLFVARYPVQEIALVDAYGGDDQQSMRANNTSAFNCRAVASRPGVWSNHAFGTAVDLNPLLNPYVGPGFVDPPEGAPYADRSDVRPGMIVAGDEAVEAFASIGWTWGGTWASAQDYQHFSANGR